MADFRRCILALAVVALLTGLVSTASAQVTSGPFTCNATAAVPTLMRSEGLTELTGDIVLQCGGTLAGTSNLANISVFLGNTTITSRILNTTTGESEVLLLVDEPTTSLPGAPASFVTTPGAANRNVFTGVISNNQVTFIGVPVVATASLGINVPSRIFRITNIRANASAVGTGASGTPGQVTAFVSMVGPASIPVNNAQQTVGFVQRGLAFSVRNAQTANVSESASIEAQIAAGTRSLSNLTFAQCASRGTGTNARQTPVAALRFAENFATAFKVRGTFDPSTGLSSQTVPGAIYNTESGLFVSGLATTGVTVPTAAAGIADFGTRLRAVFNNIPNGVNVFVSNRNVIGRRPSASGDVLEAVLVASEVAPTVFPSGVGAVVPTNTFNTGVSGASDEPVTQLTVTGGTAVAVWEVIDASPTAQEFADFWVHFGWSANPANNVPATGTGTVAGTYAPISTVATASATAPIPRFADTASANNILVIVACRTNLLFPFVTNQAGFDTGIAIANTTKDIFDTSAQAGTCTLNFFGDNAPAAVTTPSISGGSVFTALAQTTAPNFQGYVIAQCGFQFGHGFAFVQSSVGYNPSTAAMGYLALVIPDQTDNSRGRIAITLDAGNGELLGQ